MTTVGELRAALAQFDDDEIVVAGIPWWECCLTTELTVKRYKRDEGEERIRWNDLANGSHSGGIMGIDDPSIDSLVLIDDRNGR